ncbi:hypothetical protein [Cytobacillus firmus]|nr:hypothetical protein [Cytobacillus firmus]
MIKQRSIKDKDENEAIRNSCALAVHSIKAVSAHILTIKKA